MRENFIILDQFDLVKMINQRIHKNTERIVNCNMTHNTFNSTFFYYKRQSIRFEGMKRVY